MSEEELELEDELAIDPLEEEEEIESDASEEEEELDESSPDPEKLLLQQRLDAMERQLAAVTGQQQSPAAVAPDKDEDFIGEDDVEDVLQKDGLNGFANKIARLAAKRGYERAMADLPDLIRKGVRNETAVQRAIDGFFGENPQLAKGSNRKYVDSLMATMATQNPNQPMKEFLASVREKASTDLKLKRQASGDRTPIPTTQRRVASARKTAQADRQSQDAQDILAALTGEG